jgi:Arc/MetJ-type ribon-helix-helix transcriptional regulator
MQIEKMKMNTINISLPPAMAEFVRQRTERDYGNLSEYFRDLVRERIQKEVEQDVAFLNQALGGAPAGPSAAEVEDVLKIQRRVRRKLRARGV